jgi:hypothetical protein
MIVYIAGPMSNIPLYNFPEFFRAAKILKDEGYEVRNPAVMSINTWINKGIIKTFDDWQAGCEIELKNPLPLSVYMRNDYRMLSYCDAIAFLPGWLSSKGALIEFEAAKNMCLDCYELINNELIQIDKVYLQ